MTKRLGIVCWLLLWITLFVFLQVVYKYHFFYMEQTYLFLFDGDYIQNNLETVGGFSYLVAGFLNQFFIYPYAGAAITSMILIAAALLTRSILKRVAPQAEWPLLYLLPATFLMFIHFHFNYYLQGSISFLLCLLSLYGYLRIASLPQKLIAAILFIPLLFWLAGSVSILFALVVLVKEAITHPRKRAWFLVPCAEALLVAVYAVRSGWVGEYRLALLPDMYFNFLMKPDTRVLYLSWASLLFVIIIASLLRDRRVITGKRQVISITIQVLVILFIIGYRHSKYLKDDTIKFKQLEYYNRTAQWDEILRISDGPINNFLFACYLNRALAEKGMLGERMFEFDQPGIDGLMVKWNHTYAVSRLLSDILFTFGSIGASQEKAFEANLSSPDGNNAYMLQRLVQTNLIFGEYDVARKYMDILGKTLYYREWANGHGRFLNNDEAVAADPLLGNKRGFLTSDTFYQETGLLADIDKNARANPRDKTAIEYLGAAYLLSKAMQPFGKLLEARYGTEVLPVLPKSFQEAAIILYDKEPGSWPERGISAQTIERFRQFEAFMSKNKGRPRLNLGVKQHFGNTYWYYFMYK